MINTSGLDRRTLLKGAAASAALAAPASVAGLADAAPGRTAGTTGTTRRAPAMSSSGLCQSRLGRMHDALARHVDDGTVPGVVALVGRGGDVHVEAIGTLAFDGNTPMQRDTIFRMASVTKPIVAAATMTLVEECALRLDDPVDPLLPELANPKVLRAVDAPLDDTVPAKRPITLRDLLTFRLGTGAVMVFPSQYPIQKAMEDEGIAAGAEMPSVDPDEYMRRVGKLPLVHQPGEVWMYNTGLDVLGVLIARATGKSLGDFLQERIFDPLGMKDTGFSVPADKLDRLPTLYWTNFETGKFEVFDVARGGRFASPPAFESGAGGLVSTVDDMLAFGQMMLNMGEHGNDRILSRPSVELMTTDQLTAEQKAASPFFPGFWDNRGWGLGMSVITRRDDLANVPGRYGWDGGYGTSFYVDPAEGLIGVLMTQRVWDTTGLPKTILDFWTSAYQAIAD